MGARTNLHESENHLIARFIGGLRPDIKEKVNLQSLGFLTDVIALAETVEEMNEQQSKRFTQRNRWEASSSGAKKGTQSVQKTLPTNNQETSSKNIIDTPPTHKAPNTNTTTKNTNSWKMLQMW